MDDRARRGQGIWERICREDWTGDPSDPRLQARIDAGPPPPTSHRYDEVLTIDMQTTPASARILAENASAKRGRRVLVRYRHVETGEWVDPWEAEE